MDKFVEVVLGLYQSNDKFVLCVCQSNEGLLIVHYIISYMCVQCCTNHRMCVCVMCLRSNTPLYSIGMGFVWLNRNSLRLIPTHPSLLHPGIMVLGRHDISLSVGHNAQSVAY